MKSFKNLLFLFTPNERKNLLVLFVMITIMALLDMIGVGTILPFIAVITNPSLIETNLILNNLFEFSKLFGVKNVQQFFLFFGILLFVIFVTSLIFKTLVNYMQIRFVYMQEYSLGKRLLERYLNQPYEWFLSHNSADISKKILSEITGVIENGIRPIMELFAKGMASIALLILLITVNPKVAFIVGLTFIITYLLIFYYCRRKLNYIGLERLKNNELRFETISEAFGASKEIKLAGLEINYINKFSNYAKIIAGTQATTQVFAQLPRYILEIIAFGGILLITLIVIYQTNNLNSVLPMLSLYVFAGYRLLPALQQVYGSIALITFAKSAINELYDDLRNHKPYNDEDGNRNVLPLKQSISLKNISFKYANTSKKILNKLNLTVPVKSKIGIIGSTGCGKSTLVDIILGLLKPCEGTVNIDREIITEKNIRSWQRSLGYVPQHIYLCDDTIAANIAFGVKKENINFELIEKVSKIANLHKFVIEELPDQYDTKIGERGVRLSGGQRQRIGIARSLYHNPKILILDEATSALDNKTEEVVMDAIKNISKDMTIIIIAHRLNTVRDCDFIFDLDKNKVQKNL